MTLIKSKKVKEVVDNIKQEQQENGLNWIQKTDDWEERYIEVGEELEETRKKLEDETLKVELAKINEEVTKDSYREVLLERDKKIRTLEEKDESQRISLLKEQHGKEIIRLESSSRLTEDLYCRSIEKNQNLYNKVENLEKELEEKEVFIERLEENNKLLTKELDYAWSEGRTHLGAAEIAGELAEKKFLAEKEKLETKLNDKSETLLDFIDMLAKEMVETKKLRAESEEKDGKIRDISEELAKEKQQKESLKTELNLANKPLPNLPKTPSKFKILKGKMRTKFQNLIEKTKQQSQELVAKIEVKTK